MGSPTMRNRPYPVLKCSARSDVNKNMRVRLTCVGWDAMITDEGPTFFEGNVAAYRTPRRMALSLSLADGFRSWMATRGKRSAAT